MAIFSSFWGKGGFFVVVHIEIIKTRYIIYQYAHRHKKGWKQNIRNKYKLSSPHPFDILLKIWQRCFTNIIFFRDYHFLYRRKFMLDHPEDITSTEVITLKKQLMFAIQIAYGMVCILD